MIFLESISQLIDLAEDTENLKRKDILIKA